jgi:hypothetical protein
MRGREGEGERERGREGERVGEDGKRESRVGGWEGSGVESGRRRRGGELLLGEGESEEETGKESRKKRYHTEGLILVNAMTTNTPVNIKST